MLRYNAMNDLTCDTTPLRQRAADHWPALAALVGVPAITFAVFSYALFDQPLARWAHTGLPTGVEAFFDRLTQLGSSEPWLIWGGVMLALCIIFRFWRQAAMLGLILASVAASGLFVNFIKWIAGRVRPEGLLVHDQYGFEWFHTNYHLTSFPSGHSATIVAAMTAIALLCPRLIALWATVAILVVASRVAVTAHYPSDVIVGSWIGFTFALMLNALWLDIAKKHTCPIRSHPQDI